MLLIIPFIFLIFSGLGIFVVKQLNFNVGRIWLIAMVLSLVNWILILGLRLLMPLKISLLQWYPFTNFYEEGILFSFDANSWPIVLALASIQLAIILTDSTHLEELPSTNVWSGIFIINAIGILAVLSSSLLAVILLWTLIDIVELFIVIFTVPSEEHKNIAIVSFAVKLAGTFLFITTIFIAFSKDLSLTLASMALGAGTWTLVAIALRLGVVPFNLPYSKETPLRIGLGTTIRMVGVASSLIILIRIVPVLFVGSGLQLLYLLSVLTAIISALMWMVSKNELSGRPFWIIALSSFVIQSALIGNGESALIWSLNLLLVGSVIFLYSNRDRRILFLPLLAMVGFSGLPFTPSAAGWTALVGLSLDFPGIFNLFTLILLMLGYIRHAIRPARSLTANEKWMWVIFPTGLFVLILTQWFVFLLSDFNWVEFGVLWGSLIVILIPITVVIVLRRVAGLTKYSDWLVTLLNKIGDILIAFLGLNWLYKAIWVVFGFIQRIINLFSSLLESQSGMIWVIVLIAALTAIIQPNKAR